MCENNFDNNRINEMIKSIDKVLHSSARLSIMIYLYVVEYGDAVYLMNQTGLTWGNLSTHLKKLEEAGYVNVRKEFMNKKPRTILSLTMEGREALLHYKQNIKNVLDEVK